MKHLFIIHKSLFKLYSKVKYVRFVFPLHLTLISIMPIMPIGYEAITPLLGVLSMAFWIVHRPDLMSWSFVIIVGIIMLHTCELIKIRIHDPSDKQLNK